MAFINQERRKRIYTPRSYTPQKPEKTPASFRQTVRHILKWEKESGHVYLGVASDVGEVLVPKLMYFISIDNTPPMLVKIQQGGHIVCPKDYWLNHPVDINKEILISHYTGHNLILIHTDPNTPTPNAIADYIYMVDLVSYLHYGMRHPGCATLDACL